MKITIFTLNTHKGFSFLNTRFILPQLRDALRSTGAEIVFLQEVVGEHELKKKKIPHWPSNTQYEFLAHEIWPQFAYGKNAVYTQGHHGNAILSRFPIEKSIKIDISTNRVEQRGFLYSKIVVDCKFQKKNIHCFCLHLGLFEVSRRKQFRMIADYITEHIPENESLIIAGDFNDWQGRESANFCKELELYNASERDGKNVKTFPAHRPFLSLDRVYTRNLRTETVTVCHDGIWNKLSDHAGLLVKISLA